MSEQTKTSEPVAWEIVGEEGNPLRGFAPLYDKKTAQDVAEAWEATIRPLYRHAPEKAASTAQIVAAAVAFVRHGEETERLVQAAGSRARAREVAMARVEGAEVAIDRLIAAVKALEAA